MDLALAALLIPLVGVGSKVGHDWWRASQERKRERITTYQSFRAAADRAWIVSENYLPLTNVNMFAGPLRLWSLRQAGVLDELRGALWGLMEANSRLRSMAPAEVKRAADDLLSVLDEAATAATSRSSSSPSHERLRAKYNLARDTFEVSTR
jgi:hypothetical protein